MENSVKQFSVGKQSADSQLVNKLSSSEFLVDDNVERKRFCISLHHEQIKPDIQFKINELFVNLCGGWSNTTSQTLDARISTIRSWRGILLRLGVWWSVNHPNLPLSGFSEVEVKQLLVDALSNNIGWREGLEYEPISRGMIETLYLFLNRSREFKLKGLAVDGISFDFPKKFLKRCLKNKLKEFDLTYHEWVTGNPWESVPLPVAMSLLGDAISTIRDPKSKFLIDFFKYMRSEESISAKGVFKNGTYDTYRKNQNNRPHARFEAKAKELEKIVLTHFPDSDGDFPFTSNADLVNHCIEVFDASVTTFLCLTGIRLSELASISADDYDLKTDGTWLFKSELIKTGFGIPETREMSGLAAEAADLLTNLSYIDKRDRSDGKRILLFSRYFYYTDYNKNKKFRSTFRTTSKEGLRDRLNRYYDKFLSNHTEFKELCDSVHPHRFRHTWAEFAIRRFDGNVLEAIRAHFRHSYGSRFTKHYVFDKLSEEVKEKIEKNYLTDILTSLALENVEALKDPSFKKDLIGKLAKYISQAMGAEVLTIGEIDDFVEVMTDEFERIIAHEYGFCIVRTETVSQSKCLDRETQTPKLQKACFELCSGCVHYLASKSSNEESITRIAVSHQQMIEDHERIFGTNVRSDAIEISKRTLKEAESILASMDSEK